MLRFFFGVRRRCVCDVSTVDTGNLPGPVRPLPSAYRRPQDDQHHPGILSERVSQKP